MKRPELHRKTPLGSGAPLARPRAPRFGKSNRKREADNAFRDLRKVALNRSGGWCEVCDQERPLDVHHRLKRSGINRERVSNYIAACRPCHDEIHAKPQWSRVNGWILGEHQSPPATPVKYLGRWVRLEDDGGVVEQ